MTQKFPDSRVESSWGERRSRIVEWHDPHPTKAASMSMRGIDYLTAMMDGRLPPPPMAGLMRVDATEVTAGRVVFTCVPDESMYNAIGAIHGGAVCTLLDFVAGCALLSTLPAGATMASIEIKVNYLRPIHPGSGTLSATGTLVKAGRRIAFSEGIAVDAKGEIVATASSTLALSGV